MLRCVMVYYCKALTRLLYVVGFERGVPSLIESNSPKAIGVAQGL